MASYIKGQRKGLGMNEHHNRYRVVDFKIPPHIAREARSALSDLEEYGTIDYERPIDQMYSKGMAHILAEDGELDIQELERMLRYFKIDAESKYPYKEASRSSDEGIIWRLWGGTPGEEWAYKLDHQIREIDSGWKRSGPTWKRRYAP